MATAPQLLPYQPGLVDSARDTIAEGLLSLGLYKNNPYRAYRMAENLSGLMDFIPVIGDVKGGAEAADAFSEGDYATGTGLGLLTALGAFPGAGDVAAGALKSMFVTPSRVATFKHTLGDEMGLERAQELEQANVSPAEIWDKTAWFRGADGQWRTELSDKQSRWTDFAYDQLNETFDEVRPGTVNEPLMDLFEHNKLYETLPDLELVQMQLKEMPIGEAGAYTENDRLLDLVGMNPPPDYMHLPNLEVSRKNLDIMGFSPDDARMTALHEIQHAIQDLQGTARGSNQGRARHEAIDAFDVEQDFLEREMKITDRDLDPFDLAGLRREAADIFDPYKNYRLSAGEQEAFLTEGLLFKDEMDLHRLGLPAGRQGVAPYFMQTVSGMTRSPMNLRSEYPNWIRSEDPDGEVLTTLEHTGGRFINQDPTGILEGLTKEQARAVVNAHMKMFKPPWTPSAAMLARE
jgi:hypothetical protein